MKDFSLKAAATPKPADTLGPLLDGLDDAQLLALRRKIDVRLKVEVKDLRLTEELGLQYRQGQVLLGSIQDDDDTPANQKAQVYTSVSGILDKIIKQQGIVYSAERLKRFEAAFLKILQKLPPEDKEIYFDLYGEFLNDRGV